MKDYFSGLFHCVISFLMWIPCHPLRRLISACVMKRFGLKSAIYRNVDLRSPYRISIGQHTNINKLCVLDGRGGLTIGDNVDIAQETNIWTEQHDYNSPSYQSITSPVLIEDYVWIASRVTILPGVTIGRGAVVGGVPAKIIGYRKEDALQYEVGDRAWFR